MYAVLRSMARAREFARTLHHLHHLCYFQLLSGVDNMLCYIDEIFLRGRCLWPLAPVYWFYFRICTPEPFIFSKIWTNIWEPSWQSIAGQQASLRKKLKQESCHPESYVYHDFFKAAFVGLTSQGELCRIDVSSWASIYTVKLNGQDTPIYTHIGSRTTIAISRSFDNFWASTLVFHITCSIVPNEVSQIVGKPWHEQIQGPEPRIGRIILEL